MKKEFTENYLKNLSDACLKYKLHYMVRINPLLRPKEDKFCLLPATNSKEERMISLLKRRIHRNIWEFAADYFYNCLLENKNNNLEILKKYRHEIFIKVKTDNLEKRIAIIFNDRHVLERSYPDELLERRLDSLIRRRQRFNVDQIISVVENLNEFDISNLFDWFSVLNFEQLFESFFNKNFYYEFLSSLDMINDKVPDLVGYNIIEACTAESKSNFKNKNIKKCLIDFSKNDLTNSLYASELLDFESNLDLNVDLFIGFKPYAESLFTSEWLYQNMKKDSQLDMTYIVSGYFKAMEQFLAQIVVLRGKNLELQTFNGYEIENSDDLALLNSSIKMMNAFIRKNKLITENNYFNNYIYNKINEWTDDTRNGYLHKDNITNYQNVVDIRKATYEILSIILGELYLTDDEFNVCK